MGGLLIVDLLSFLYFRFHLLEDGLLVLAETDPAGLHLVSRAQQFEERLACVMKW
jgi:hypothetical protein